MSRASTDEGFRLKPNPSAKKSTTLYSPLGFLYPNVFRDSSALKASTMGDTEGEVEVTMDEVSDALKEEREGFPFSPMTS